MSSSSLPFSRSFSSARSLFSFWYRATSWLRCAARSLSVTSSLRRDDAFCLSAASCSESSFTSSSADFTLDCASVVRRCSSRMSVLARSSCSRTTSSSEVRSLSLRSAASARRLASSTSRWSRASDRPPPWSSICSSSSCIMSRSRSRCLTASWRSSALVPWYSLDSCRIVASLESCAACCMESTPCGGSILATSSMLATWSRALRSCGETSRPDRKGSRWKSFTTLHSTGACFAAKE
mmetsp:Transcript_7876/g.31191  ORF Transcript_7876/g.31191 Transcript_7876/m.31191 type:complete len:238 (+) Transcript_7876:286-999(+)